MEHHAGAAEPLGDSTRSNRAGPVSPC